MTRVWVAALTRVSGAEAALWRARFAAISEVLSERGLGPWEEPAALPTEALGFRGAPEELQGYEQLRALAAHQRWGEVERGEDGRVLVPEPWRLSHDKVLARGMQSFRHHLLTHHPREGLFVPVDFPEVLVDAGDRVPGACLGSSVRLLDELHAVAPMLDIALREPWVEVKARRKPSDASYERLLRAAEAGEPVARQRLSHEAARRADSYGMALSGMPDPDRLGDEEAQVLRDAPGSGAWGRVRLTWWTLHEAARLSVVYGTAVVMGTPRLSGG